MKMRVYFDGMWGEIVEDRGDVLVVRWDCDPWFLWECRTSEVEVIYF